MHVLMHIHTYMQQVSSQAAVISGGMPDSNQVFVLFTSPQIGWTDATVAIKSDTLGCQRQGAAVVGLTLFLLGGKLADGSVRNASYRYVNVCQ